MNILSTGIIRTCTSCQMCAAVCPMQAIDIRLDKDGFYRPTVSEKCIDCGLCVSVCYKYDPNVRMTSPEALDNMPLYAAVARDNDIIAATTSGGVADLLARQLTGDGYACVGVCYDVQNKRAYDKIVTTPAESACFRGSKYIQSYTVDAFREIVKSGVDRKIAVFGTPCHIYALDKYLRSWNRRGNFILIDLYCHGCPTLNLWHKYLKEIETGFHGQEPDNVNFRSKVHGWGRFCILVTANGKDVFKSNGTKDPFFSLFFSNHLLNEACHDCSLRSTLAYTDIRLGDFWGRCYDLNSRGVSVVSIASESGQQAFDSICDKLEITQHKYADALPYQSWGKRYHPNPIVRHVLLEQVADPGMPLNVSVKYYRSRQAVGAKVKAFLKSAVLRLPDRWVNCLKRMYH